MESSPPRQVAQSVGNQRVPVSVGADPLRGHTGDSVAHSAPRPKPVGSSAAIPPSGARRPTQTTPSPLSAAVGVTTLSSFQSSEQYVNLKRKKIVSEAPENIDGLHCMMRVGAWKDTVKLAEKLHDIEKKPYEKLQLKLMMVVALTRLRDYRGALQEIETLGNLSSSNYLFESYPQYYPDKQGTMVPFSLLVLSAELQQLAEPEHSVKSLDMLYHLLDQCREHIRRLGKVAPSPAVGRTASSPAGQSPRRKKRRPKRLISELLDDDAPRKEGTEGEGSEGEGASNKLLDIADSSEGNGSSNGEESDSSESDSGLSVEDLDSISPKFITPPSSPTLLRRSTQASRYFEDLNAGQQIWRLREVRVMFTIATHLIRNHDLATGILVLQEILELYPKDTILLSCIGRVHIQLGNLGAAREIFARVEDLLGNPDSTLALMNNGYLHMANENFKEAARQFQKVMEQEPSNLTATNNRAVCWLYTCNLPRAISSLEETILRDPENTLKETIVFNLATLYDLGAEDTIDKKKKLMALIAKFGPDDFDPSLLRMS